MKQDKHISGLLKLHLEKIKEIYSPKGLWFFGSRVSGMPKEDSDIDMLLVSDKFKGTKFIYRMGDFLKTIDYPKHIDALCYTAEEFDKKKQSIGIIKQAIETGEKII